MSKTENRISFWAIVTLACVCVLGRTGTAGAQEFYVYADNAADENWTIWGLGSFVEDPGPGCWHTDIAVQTGIWSPSRSAFGSTEAGLFWDEEEGDWIAGAEMSLWCSCFGPMYSGVVWSQVMSTRLARSVYTDPAGPSGGFCLYGEFACASGSPSCGTPPHFINVGSAGSCSPYMLVRFLYVASRYCLAGTAYVAGGPGSCS